MSYEGGNLDMALVAAVGNDPALIHDLRRAFMESADRQIDMAARAKSDDEWQRALWRLRGLCGSFGVISLLDLVTETEQAKTADLASIKRLRAALKALGAE